MQRKDEFERHKAQRLQHVDVSRKGSIDIALQESVSFINTLPNYFTTSSCSGRIILFENQICSKIQKKGCRWLHVTHGSVDIKDLESALTDITGEAVLKFEPMVMHVQCQRLEDAQQMHQIAVASGFRNSGITVGTKGKIIVAIRSTHSLEVPLSCEGQVLVGQKHLEHLVDSANSKMHENSLRIDRFYSNLQGLSNKDSPHKHQKSKPTSRGERSDVEKMRTSLSKSPQKEEEGNSTDLDNNDSLSLFIFDNT